MARFPAFFFLGIFTPVLFFAFNHLQTTAISIPELREMVEALTLDDLDDRAGNSSFSGNATAAGAGTAEGNATASDPSGSGTANLEVASNGSANSNTSETGGAAETLAEGAGQGTGTGSAAGVNASVIIGTSGSANGSTGHESSSASAGPAPNATAESSEPDRKNLGVFLVRFNNISDKSEITVTQAKEESMWKKMTDTTLEMVKTVVKKVKFGLGGILGSEETPRQAGKAEP